MNGWVRVAYEVAQGLCYLGCGLIVFGIGLAVVGMGLHLIKD